MGIPLARTKGDTFQGVVNEVTFLPALGHDLRAPLTALKGRLQLLQRRLGRHSDRAEDLHDVENMLFHVARMSHQLDIVRDASQLRWGTFDLVCAPADLSTIVERALTYLRAPGSRTNLEIVIKERPLIGTLDAERLSHAVVALVSNAVRFSGENAPVRVVVSRQGARGSVEVCDEGIGVPPDERELIFAMGERATNAQRSGGAGLGLYVAREIVERHSGTLHVHARPEGGSIFELALPLDASMD
jgi:signal transduction histidine kinase